jgi:hypothetical protein
MRSACLLALVLGSGFSAMLRADTNAAPPPAPDTNAASPPATDAPAAPSAQLLTNPGFEDGLTGWAIKDKMSKIVPEAAHDGAQGLRIDDEDAKLGSHVVSGQVPAVAGHTYQLTFWARTTTAGFSAVYFWFFNGPSILTANDSNGTSAHPSQAVDQGDGEWHQYTLEAKAPEDATTIAVWIHTLGPGTGEVDFDDFSLIDKG